MEVTVNGRPREVPDGSTLAELIESLEIDPRYLAAERNLELVPREQHAECVLQPEDRIEIVTLVGGG
ncbi:MAG: sulfur carrier protein ThiS [Planctomycetota bacterium]|nr:MAG: sulfur carrier protein ThiS [Planctomycetota bacterium]REJ90516.1 MAG: sulfur carrier protein ThiS [Planctomycetota bacterium]REK24139.1 MAG: sulfur carrier protein ThiS [Planctomycetota bacterium]REK38284.1 MAG: sulfur carrier protein ThiS [Planctomycetota bacterium]